MTKLKVKYLKNGFNLICTQSNEYCNKYVTVGKIYEIEDIDKRNERVIVKSDLNDYHVSLPLSFFYGDKNIRKLKLQQLNLV